MKDFLRNVFERRKPVKNQGQELRESSSPLEEDLDRLDELSVALRRKDAALAAAASALKKSDDALAIRVLQRSVIAELGQRALLGTDLDELIKESCVLTSQVLGTEFCNVLQIDRETNSFTFRAAYGWPENFQKNYRLASNQVTDGEFTLQNKAPTQYKDLKSETRFKPPSYLLDQGVNSGVNVVILGQNTSFGILGAHSKKRREFNQDEVNFVQTVANMLGAAIQKKHSETVSSQLTNIIESSDNAIISISPEGIILSWNPYASVIFGFSEKEAVGNSILITIPEERKQEYYDAFKQLKNGKTVGHFETVRIRKDHERIDVSMTASPIKNIAGEIIGISMIARDITKEKKDADKLRKSETQLKAAQRIGQMGSWELDLSSNSLNWSNELYRIYGVNHLESTDFEGFLEIIHPDDRLHLRSLIEGKRSFSTEHRIIRPDGEVRHIQARGEVIADPEGRPIRLMGIAQDITDRKRADEQLRSSREQMRALSAHLQFIREEERSRIAREVHDELGQVLTALKMDLSLLNHKLLESSAVLPRRELYDEIRSMSKKVDATIKSVRKIVTELRPEVLDHLGLKSAIEWQAQEFQARSGIECILDPKMESIEMKDRDGETAIFRILQEALTNIAKHSGASKVDIFLMQKGGEISLEVHDNGRGISDADMSKSRSFGLLGMRERALFLGGDLEVTGFPGAGTTVKVQIPVRKQE